MHSGTRPFRRLGWVAALAFAPACGNYSNDDIIFTEALPVVGTVQVVLPAATGQPLCAIALSDTQTGAESTAAGLNQGIDGMIELIDVVRTLPPSERRVDHRGWGPWPDKDHSGFEVRVAMDRTAGSAEDGDTFTFTLDEHPVGATPWATLVTADFYGTRPDQGHGYIVIHYAVAWALGIEKASDPQSDMTLDYDFSSDPRHIGLHLGNPALGLLGADYTFDRYAAGGGSFQFSFADGKGARYDLVANFLATGAGKAVGHVQNGATGGYFSECWDAAACVSFESSPFGMVGDSSNCPQ